MRLAYLIMLVALPALGAQRISVTAFSGRGAATPRNQLLEALCGDYDCAAPATVTTKNKPDWKKAAREQVDLFLVGRVDKAKNKFVLELTLWSSPKKPAFHKKYELAGGRLAPKTLARVTKALRTAIGRTAKNAADAPSPPPPPPVDPRNEAQEPPSEQPELSDAATRSERLANQSSSNASRTESETELARETAPRPPTEAGVDPLFAIALGSDVFSRNLAYTGMQTQNLRTYRANAIFAPRIGAEIYPLSSVGGVVSGLGLEASYATAVGLASSRVDGPEHPTSLTRFDVAARFNLRLLGNDGLVLYPLAGVRQSNFKVGAAADGSVLDGLPEISYQSVMAGAGFELPLAGGLLSLRGRFVYLAVLSSGEILSASYLTNGSTSGLIATVGVGVKLMDGLEARLSGELSHYALSFHPEAGDTYVAAGATDQYLGGTVSLRYAFGG